MGWFRGPLTLAVVLGLALGCSPSEQTTAPAAAPPRSDLPSVVMILADDLGWEDWGEQAASDLRTPHLDALAASGVRFTSAYAASPVCSPARAGILTGRYPQRFGHENNTGSIGRQHDERIGLPLSERTIADLMKEAGYATGYVGKWHLGVRREFHPMRRGFDGFFGFLPGHHAYHHWNDKPHNPILRGMDVAEGDEYLTDALTREAVAFIDRHASRPFFLVLAYSAVHAPLIAEPARTERMDHLRPGARRDFAAVLAALDDGIGEIEEALARHALTDRTLVIFTSDNGSAPAGRRARALRGGKGSLFEGGLRVPLVVRWPARSPAVAAHGTRHGEPVSTLDLAATVTAAAEIAPPADGATLDGVDLADRMSPAPQQPPREALYWRIGDERAIRAGSWKLLWQGGRPPALYDLATDPRERRDLASERAERVGLLRALHASWESDLRAPRWEFLPGQPGADDE